MTLQSPAHNPIQPSIKVGLFTRSRCGDLKIPWWPIPIQANLDKSRLADFLWKSVWNFHLACLWLASIMSVFMLTADEPNTVQTYGHENGDSHFHMKIIRLWRVHHLQSAFAGSARQQFRDASAPVSLPWRYFSRPCRLRYPGLRPSLQPGQTGHRAHPQIR